MIEVYGVGSVPASATESFDHGTFRGAWLQILGLGSGDGATLLILASSKTLVGSRNRTR